MVAEVTLNKDRRLKNSDQAMEAFVFRYVLPITVAIHPVAVIFPVVGLHSPHCLLKNTSKLKSRFLTAPRLDKMLSLAGF
jgi:hypothetical protein